MTSWSAPVTRHLLEHRFWVVLNANSVFSFDGIITSKYSHSSYELKWNLNFGLIVLRLRIVIKKKKLATYWTLLRCNDLQPRFLLSSYYIELAWSLKLRLFLLTSTRYCLFCQFVQIGLPKLLFFAHDKKNCILLFLSQFNIFICEERTHFC